MLSDGLWIRHAGSKLRMIRELMTVGVIVITVIIVRIVMVVIVVLTIVIKQ